MQTMTRTDRVIGIDLDSWQSHRVPSDVMQALIFVYLHRKNKGSVTWAEIASFMQWRCARSELRGKMKRLRRWGLRWELNKPGSTRVDKKVHPFIEDELRTPW